MTPRRVALTGDWLVCPASGRSSYLYCNDPDAQAASPLLNELGRETLTTGDHTNYWKTHGGSPHPQIFASGFSQGFDDQLLFLSSASELGFVQQWAKRRMAEYESTGQKLGGADWEWEHGFKQGAEACKRVCLA